MLPQKYGSAGGKDGDEAEKGKELENKTVTSDHHHHRK
jgi:hypothetical protein